MTDFELPFCLAVLNYKRNSQVRQLDWIVPLIRDQRNWISFWRTAW